MNLFTNWFSQSALWRPSVAVYPLAYRFLRESQLLTPLSHGFRFTVERDKSIVAAIVVLLLVGCPSAVIRNITQIVVDSFQRHICRPLAHVGKEIRKSQPRIADGNSATSVTGICSVGWFRTPAYHTSPYDQY